MSFDLRSPIYSNPWRDALVTASYRGAFFHVEAGSRENGRRIVMHEFPKRDLPYAEDMGRRAYSFSVRAYCISYPKDTGEPLYQRDYREARDLLIRRLEEEGIGYLQLPLLGKIKVVVDKYRITEEQKTGGYCTFDITFLEAGQQTLPTVDTRGQVAQAANDLVNRTIDTLDRNAQESFNAGADITPLATGP